jgi:putative ABC transport system substrate-binding protein
LPDPFFYSRAGKIAEAAIQGRLLNLSGSREVVEAGGLLSYGQSVDEQYYRPATYIHKILKGAVPAGLPVEQPTKLEFAVNTWRVHRGNHNE